MEAGRYREYFHKGRGVRHGYRELTRTGGFDGYTHDSLTRVANRAIAVIRRVGSRPVDVRALILRNVGQFDWIFVDIQESNIDAAIQEEAILDGERQRAAAL